MLIQTRGQIRNPTDSQIFPREATPSANPEDPAGLSGGRLAASSADGFTYFAIVVYLGLWDWSSGVDQNSLGM